MWRASLSLLFALFLVGCSKSTPEPGAPVLYEGARLITGDGTAPIEDSAFLVVNGEFKGVGKRGSVEAPANAAHVDLKGKTVIPALIDDHAHLGWTIIKDFRTDTDTYSKENLTDHLKRYAYYGVAAMRNLGIDPGEAAFEIRANPIPGAALLQT